MSWRAWLLMLATLAVFAAAWRRCSHRMLVGDFPSVERSSRGLALAMLPHVAALVAAPSARVRTRANRAKHRELSRALRLSRVLAWFPARRCRRRYGSTRLPWRAQAPTARDRCDSAAVERPPLRSASRRWAGWRPLRCRKPGMQATARAHRRPARRYQGAGCVALALRAEQPCRRASQHVGLVVSGSRRQPCEHVASEPQSQSERGFSVREPPSVGSTVTSGGTNSHRTR